MAMLFCTNKNDFHHEDSYDGKLYVFPPNEKVELSEEAARHMFGFQEDDFTAILHRKGWGFKYNPDSKKYEDDPDGIKKLKKFVFTQAVLVEKPVGGDEKIEVVPGKERPTLHLKDKAESRA